MKTRSWMVEGLLVGVLASPVAHAAEGGKRSLPDYDGRGGPRRTPGEKALWVPRVLLSPLYFVSEFALRRPLGAVITAAEDAELPAALYDFFAFGPDHKAGVVPFAFVDFGFRPSGGVYAFWDDAGFAGHDLRLRGSFGGEDWLSGTATERFRLPGAFDVTLTGTATRRPDYAFYGIGPDTREPMLVRYASDSVDVRAVSRLAFGNSHMLETSLGYRGASFGPSSYERGASLPSAVAAGKLRDPAGFRDGWRAPFASSRLIFDSRDPETGSETGARVELTAEQAADIKNHPSAGWLRYGATVGGLWDLGDSDRIVSLALSALLADPLGARSVPFTEQVTLGGPNLMPGFREGRLYDRSALVATLRYSWPIWVWLDGSLQVATGNVFGEHFEGFRAGRGRFSAAVGIESGGSRDSIFQALFGFGTETFESGAELHSLRFVVGARRGF